MTLFTIKILLLLLLLLLNWQVLISVHNALYARVIHTVPANRPYIHTELVISSYCGIF